VTAGRDSIRFGNQSARTWSGDSILLEFGSSNHFIDFFSLEFLAIKVALVQDELERTCATFQSVFASIFVLHARVAFRHNQKIGTRRTDCHSLACECGGNGYKLTKLHIEKNCELAKCLTYVRTLLGL
jgi:hypothetical protein